MAVEARVLPVRNCPYILNMPSFRLEKKDKDKEMYECLCICTRKHGTLAITIANMTGWEIKEVTITNKSEFVQLRLRDENRIVDF